MREVRIRLPGAVMKADDEVWGFRRAGATHAIPGVDIYEKHLSGCTSDRRLRVNSVVAPVAVADNLTPVREPSVALNFDVARGTLRTGPHSRRVERRPHEIIAEGVR